MPRPDGVTRVPPGLEYLCEIDQLLVQQQLGGIYAEEELHSNVEITVFNLFWRFLLGDFFYEFNTRFGHLRPYFLSRFWFRAW